MAEDKDWRPAAEHSGCLLRLEKLLERAQGFRLLILSHNRPKYRDNLIARLREAQPDSTVFDLRQLGSLAAFEDALARQQVRQVHLLNLESLRKEQRQDFFKGLNYHREHIARTCGGFLLVWLPEHLIAKLAVEAADFWAWREQVFDFSLPLEPVERVETDWVKMRNTDALGKQQRIAEIETFFACPSEEPSLTIADLKRELGNLYKSIGEYAQAKKMLEAAIDEYGQLDEAVARAAARCDLADLLADQGKIDQALSMLQKQVLPIYKRLGDVFNNALTMGKIASILYRRGELDEALRIRDQEVLSTFEQLGDVRLKAIEQSNIANILYQRGELDEALRIWQQEVLPVFEQIGDVRSKVVTMGNIADILQQRGDLDEALRILEQEELPIYERLGDVLEKAMTMGNIADIFYQRGEMDEALRIYEQEVLPVFERLGDTHGLSICRARIAILLYQIDAKANKGKIDELLRLALADAKRLKLPREIEWIEGIMNSRFFNKEKS